MTEHRLKGFEPVEQDDAQEAGVKVRYGRTSSGNAAGDLVRAVCTCGAYKSGPGEKTYAFRSHAAHARVKNKKLAHKR